MKFRQFFLGLMCLWHLSSCGGSSSAANARRAINLGPGDIAEWNLAPGGTAHSMRQNQSLSLSISDGVERSFVAHSLEVSSGKYYVFSAQILGLDSSLPQGAARLQIISAVSEGLSHYEVTSADVGKRVGLIFRLEQDSTILIRIGLGVNGSIAGHGTVTISKPQIQTLSSATEQFDDYVPTLGVNTGYPVSYQPEFSLLNGFSGEVTRTKASRQYFPLHPTASILFTGDSQGNDSQEYPRLVDSRLHIARVAHTAGAKLSMIASDFHSEYFADAADTLSENLDVARFGVVVIEGGINDIIAADQLDPSDSMLQQIANMVELALINGSSVILLNLAPFGSSAHWNPQREEYRKNYNSRLSHIFEPYEDVYLADVDQWLGDSQGNLLPLFDSGDGLHWSVVADGGNATVAQHLKAILTAISESSNSMLH